MSKRGPKRARAGQVRPGRCYYCGQPTQVGHLRATEETGWERWPHSPNPIPAAVPICELARITRQRRAA